MSGVSGSSASAGSPSRSASRERLRSVGHYLTAAVLALKGYSKLEHPEGHRALIGVCFASAAIIVVVTALHSKLRRHAAKIESLVYVLEATVAGTMAVVMAEEGKHGLPFMWAIAAAGFLTGAVVRWRRGMAADSAATGGER